MNYKIIIKNLIKPHIPASATRLFIILLIFGILYLLINKFKLIEGNSFKEKAKDEESVKKESEEAYRKTDEILPPADHIKKGM